MDVESDGLQFELATVPTIIMTIIVAVVITSGRRQWFGQTVVLSLKEYIIRCFIVTSIIVGTLYSLVSDASVGDFMDQKMLAVITLGIAIAVEHFYGAQDEIVPELSTLANFSRFPGQDSASPNDGSSKIADEGIDKSGNHSSHSDRSQHPPRAENLQIVPNDEDNPTFSGATDLKRGKNSNFFTDNRSSSPFSNNITSKAMQLESPEQDNGSNVDNSPLHQNMRTVTHYSIKTPSAQDEYAKCLHVQVQEPMLDISQLQQRIPECVPTKHEIRDYSDYPADFTRASAKQVFDRMLFQWLPMFNRSSNDFTSFKSLPLQSVADSDGSLKAKDLGYWNEIPKTICLAMMSIPIVYTIAFELLEMADDMPNPILILLFCISYFPITKVFSHQGLNMVSSSNVNSSANDKPLSVKASTTFLQKYAAFFSWITLGGTIAMLYAMSKIWPKPPPPEVLLDLPGLLIALTTALVVGALLARTLDQQTRHRISKLALRSIGTCTLPTENDLCQMTSKNHKPKNKRSASQRRKLINNFLKTLRQERLHNETPQNSPEIVPQIETHQPGIVSLPASPEKKPNQKSKDDAGKHSVAKEKTSPKPVTKSQISKSALEKPIQESKKAEEPQKTKNPVGKPSTQKMKKDDMAKQEPKFQKKDKADVSQKPQNNSNQTQTKDATQTQNKKSKNSRETQTKKTERAVKNTQTAKKS